MPQMQRVLWTKGVVLTPQHLQSQDRFLEELMGTRLASLTHYPWGFSRLELDREALTGGLLAVSAAEGLFPDGLPFQIPGADAAPAPKPLAGAFGPDIQHLTAYLAIPEYRVDGHNVSTASQGGDTRYLAQVLNRRDENTGLAEKPIQVARKNLRLLAEGESQEGSLTLPIARILKTSSGELELDPHFVPPLVDIGASEYLITLTRRLVELLSSKSGELAGTRRQRGQTLADFGIADVANFWLLYTSNTFLPLVRHFHSSRRGHPARLFETMLSLSGALTTFSSSLDHRSLPEYDHQDLTGSFTRLDEVIRTLLGTVVPTRHVSLPLKAVEPSVYATAIDQDRHLTAPQIFLAVRADLDRADIIERATELIKISSHSRLERLYKHGLPGLGMTHVPQPPSAIPVKLGHEYFKLETSGEEWDEITLARSLAAYVPSAFPNPELELVLILPPD